MKRTLKIISIFIILITALSLYGFIIRHVTLGGDKMGHLSEPLKHFSSFPKTVYDVLNSNEIKGTPVSSLKRDSSFKEKNIMDYNLYGLNSFYSTNKNRWDIRLLNFKNDSIIHEWFLLKENYHRKEGRIFRRAVPKHGILLPDRNLIIQAVPSNNLYKLDRESNIVWHNTDKRFHHSLNLDNDSNVWGCTEDSREFLLGKKKNRGQFKDQFITKVNNETGEILYDESVSDILIENGYENFVYGFSNEVDANSDSDPLHLNDVQPVLKDGPYWKKEDLFISLRHKSLIIHYRPETKEIIRMIYGPFLFQHDVDIISDHEIALFNNNTTTIGNFEVEVEKEKTDDKILYSEILVYNYKDSTFNTIFKNQFEKEKIYTRTEGLFELLPTGDVYVENHNDGELYIFNNDEILLKKQFITSDENLVHMPTWIRIYKNIDF